MLPAIPDDVAAAQRGLVEAYTKNVTEGREARYHRRMVLQFLHNIAVFAKENKAFDVAAVVVAPSKDSDNPFVFHTGYYGRGHLPLINAGANVLLEAINTRHADEIAEVVRSKNAKTV